MQVCLTVIKKRRGLINKVKEINESLKALYHTKCSDTGLTVKTKQVPVHTSAKKLKFSEDDLETRQDDKEYSHAEYLSQWPDNLALHQSEVERILSRYV